MEAYNVVRTVAIGGKFKVFVIRCLCVFLVCQNPYLYGYKTRINTGYCAYKYALLKWVIVRWFLCNQMFKFVSIAVNYTVLDQQKMLKRKKIYTVLSPNHNVTLMDESALPGKKNQVMIDLPNEERIQYWMNELSCGRADLLYAVINVGHSFTAVEAFLTMNHRKKSSGKQ